MVFRVGVDPGKSGGAVLLDSALTVREVFSFKKGGESGWVDFVSRLPEGTRASVEQVWSSPAMGVVSAFSFGENSGFLRGVLLARRIPTDFVRPAQWQTGLGLPKKKQSPTAHKRALRDAATRLFPDHKWALDTCDAVLIARHAVRDMP